ncbi:MULTISPECIES: hypothetical protein [unclassified Dyella]|uniref:hypothetical protein n=1 Tax=unclassified Dyella TaxID=2634549 RepID=UPI000CBA3B4F|nr:MULTISPECIES: hypothetical protein [unclassified Dyella]MDR3447177.1 hypothetical protein [Dyella sp.]PMQ04665.1 hypothetical protein DyAD56_13385 [Dyella sp. AD56]
MKKWIAFGLLAVSSMATAQTTVDAALAAPRIDVRSWLRMSPADYGCFTEKTLGYRDTRFNCALKGYQNRGDICKTPDAYYEGPEFPDRLATDVHPLATRVVLSWEHGNLQAVSITLKGTWSEAQVRQAFHLPRAAASKLSIAEQKAHAWPQNIMDTDVQYPTQGQTAVTLIGFDHMGAADVGCGEGG